MPSAENTSDELATLIFVSQFSTPESLNLISKALFNIVDAENTIIFDTIPSSTYLAGVRLSVPAIRRICSSAAHSDDSTLPPFLESPYSLKDSPLLSFNTLNTTRKKL